MFSELGTRMFLRKFWIEVFISVAGFMLILIGLFGGGEKLSAVVVGIGCSLLAGAIVSAFATWHAYRVSHVAEIIGYWGLRSIFKTRSKMNSRCDETFVTLHKHLDIIGWGMRSFRHSEKARIDLPTKLKNGLKVRILAPNPDSPFVRQQDKDEGKADGSTAHDIVALSEWVQQMAKYGDIELRYYPFRPQDFYFRQDDYVYTGPYLYGIDSQQTISFEYEYPSHSFDLYTRQFDAVWNSSLKISEQA